MTIKNLTLLLIAFFVVACGRPYRPDVTSSAPQKHEKILLLDHGLTYYFNVVQSAANRTPGGQLIVKTEIENEEDKDVWCDVQVVFKGQDGFELEKTNWQPTLFHRRTTTTLQQTSLNASAADYLVYIRNVK